MEEETKRKTKERKTESERVKDKEGERWEEIAKHSYKKKNIIIY